MRWDAQRERERELHLRTLQGVRIDHVNDARNLGAQHNGADVALRGCKLCRKTEEVLAADGRDLHREGVLVAIGVVDIVLRDQLLGALVANGYDIVEKVDKLERMAAVREEKVDAIANLFDVDGLLRGLVLEDQLFEEIEGALVVHLEEMRITSMSTRPLCTPPLLCCL